MKKYLVTSLCLLLTILAVFKLIPGIYPGIKGLDQMDQLVVTPIEDNNFTERIEILTNIINKNNKVGNAYIIDNVQKLNEASNGTVNFDKINPTAPINETVISNQILTQAKTNTTTVQTIDLNNIILQEVKEEINGDVKKPIFVFTINGQVYTSGVGLIGNSDVFVESIDVPNGKVVLKKGQDTRVLLVDQTTNKTEILNQIQGQ